MMKKCYQIIHTADQPDWAVAPRAQIDQLLWKPQTQITAYAQLVCGDDRLFVHLHADEDAIRAEETDPLAQPCQDSCLEFFLSPAEGDARYLNIEMNPNCCLYFGIGTGRDDLVRLLPTQGVGALNAHCTRSETGWDLYYSLPFSLLRLFFPAFHPHGIMRGNFYKCGDLTQQEHYLAWNRVACAEPDFHRPEFFGELEFA